MQEVRLPSLGEGVEHGDIVRVTVNKDDYVKENQTVLELETDKALIEVPCSARGTVEQVHVEAGQRIEVGALLITVGEASAESKQTTAKPEQQAKAESTGEPSIPQSEKSQSKSTATATTSSPKREPTQRQLVAIPKLPDIESIQQRHPSELPFDPNEVAPAAGPATRRLARELGVDLRLVPGSGRHGRINQEDVRGFIKNQLTSVSTASQRGCPVCRPELPDFTQWGEVVRESLGKVRQTIAQHLSQSYLQVPQVTQFERADITELEALRKKLKPEAAKREVHLTLMPFVIKAIAQALTQFPKFNSSIDPGRGDLILKRYFHIGIATDTPRGLLVPVLRDVERKSVWQLAGELDALAEKARTGKVDIADLRGATFSISNQGGLGGEHFTPLVNHPEAAILGLGQARWQPTYLNGPEQPPIARLSLPLAVGYDHRIVDGANAVRFITHLKCSLEDPILMLLGV